MAQWIRIKMDGKEENVAIAENLITESSIKHAFLLPPDAIVKLSFEFNGMKINCATPITAKQCFLLPNDWSTMAFFAESNMTPSRPATSMDIPQSSASIYVPIDNDSLVHQLEKFLFYEKTGGIMACFTVISSHHAVSFNHGSHQNWNSSSVENQTSVTICNQAGQEFRTQLITCNAGMDYVVVRSEVPLVPMAPTISVPHKFERYILLALEGIISVQLDSKGRMRGSKGSQQGYSGGPIFNHKGELLGIHVAHGSSKKLSLALSSLSVIVPVYYLACGIRENLNFQQ